MQMELAFTGKLRLSDRERAVEHARGRRFEFGLALLSIGALSFLGLGARPPSPEWGAMLADGRVLLRHAPWVTIAPGLAITLSVLAFNLLGDALRDALNVRMQQ